MADVMTRDDLNAWRPAITKSRSAPSPSALRPIPIRPGSPSSKGRFFEELAVGLPRRKAARARRLRHRRHRRPADLRGPGQKRPASRLLQCLQAPRPRAAEAAKAGPPSSSAPTTPGPTIWRAASCAPPRPRRSRTSSAIRSASIRSQVEEFCGFVYVNLDGQMLRRSGSNRRSWQRDHAVGAGCRKPDLRASADLRHRSNWKNVVDNFLECYHCPVAHKDFCTLVDMDTYRVTTHGIYSSHMAEAGKTANAAYSVEGATVKDHAVWWLWPNTCLMRYPGRGNMIVMHIIPVRRRPYLRDLRLLLRGRRAERRRAGSDPLYRRRAAGGGHQPGRERAARHEHPRLHPGPHRPRSRGLRQIRARRAPLPRPGARRLPATPQHEYGSHRLPMGRILC